MEGWKMKYPEPSVDLSEIRKMYHSEVAEEQGLPVASEPALGVAQPKGKKGKKKGKKKK
jgi:hypothetical protein